MCAPHFPSGSNPFKTILSLSTSLFGPVLRGNAAHRPDLNADSLRDSYLPSQGDLARLTPQVTLTEERPGPSSQAGPSQFWRQPTPGESVLVTCGHENKDGGRGGINTQNPAPRPFPT